MRGMPEGMQRGHMEGTMPHEGGECVSEKSELSQLWLGPGLCSYVISISRYPLKWHQITPCVPRQFEPWPLQSRSFGRPCHARQRSGLVSQLSYEWNVSTCGLRDWKQKKLLWDFMKQKTSATRWWDFYGFLNFHKRNIGFSCKSHCRRRLIQLLDLDIGWGHRLFGFDDQSDLIAGSMNGGWTVWNPCQRCQHHWHTSHEM